MVWDEKLSLGLCLIVKYYSNDHLLFGVLQGIVSAPKSRFRNRVGEFASDFLAPVLHWRLCLSLCSLCPLRRMCVSVLERSGMLPLGGLLVSNT